MSPAQIIILLTYIIILILLIRWIWILLKDDDDPLSLFVAGTFTGLMLLISILTVISYPKTKVEKEFSASKYELIIKTTTVDNQIDTTYILKYK